MPFDPDAYLASKTSGGTATATPAFDPDEYLKSKAPKAPDLGSFIQQATPQVGLTNDGLTSDVPDVRAKARAYQAYWDNVNQVEENHPYMAALGDTSLAAGIEPSGDFEKSHPKTAAVLQHTADFLKIGNTVNMVGQGALASEIIPARLLALGFGLMSAKATLDHVQEAYKAKDPAERAGQITDAVINGVFTTLAGVGVFHEGKPVLSPEEATAHLKTVPDNILQSAKELLTTDPKYKKTLPYDPNLIHAEIARRAGLPQTAEALKNTPSIKPDETKSAPKTEGAQTSPTPEDKQLAEKPAEQKGTTGSAETPSDVKPKLSTAIYSDGEIHTGDDATTSHADIISKGAKEGKDLTDGTKGFTDENGKFITRTDAAKMALDSGTIDQPTYDNAMLRTGEDKGLHSEDLKGESKPDEPAPPTKPEDQPKVTSIKNDQVDAERKARGLPPRVAPIAKKLGASWDEGMKVIEKNPEAGKNLVDSLKKQSRPLTDTEDAILTHEQITRQNDYDKAADEVNNAKTDAERAEANVKLAQARDAVFDVYDVGSRAGTANARGLNARKLMVKEDYSLSRMESQKRAANDGKPLSDSQLKETKDLHDKIQELEKRIEAHESGKKDAEVSHYFDQLLKETAKQSKEAAKKGGKFSDFVESQAEQARARIKARGGRLMAGLNPVELVDHAIIGASYIAKGITAFKDWSVEMVKEFSDSVKPYLADLFERSKQYHEANAKLFKEDTTADQKATVEQVLAKAKTEKELNPQTVYNLARAHVNAGVDGFDNVMKAVHSDLAKIHDGLTERDVRDAFSGYGKVKFPSKEEDLTKLREYRRLAQLTSAIEDANKGEAPKKTGSQRDKPTQTVREKMAELKAAMEANGIETQSPEDQLASKNQARATALKNQIEDLDKRLKTGEKPPKGTPVPDSAEVERLKSERDAMKSQLKEIEDGENPPKTPAQKQVEQLSKVKQRLDETLSGARDKTMPKPFEALSQAAADIKAEIQSMHELAAQLEREANPLKPEEEKKIEAIQKRTQELRDKIASGDLSAKSGKPTVDTKGLADAKAELKKLNDQMADMRKSANPTDPNAAKQRAQIKALKDSIADYEKRIAAKDFSAKTGGASRPDTKEVSDLREIRDARKAAYDAAEKASRTVKTPNEIALERYKKAIQKRTAELQEKVNAGDYTKKAANKTGLDAEALKLKADRERVRLQFDRGLVADKLSKRTGAEKFIDAIPKWSRAFKLSSPVTFAKLAAASAARMTLQPFEQAVGSGIGKIIPEIAKRAPSEGAFSARIEAKAFVEGMTTGMKDAYQKATTGNSDLSSLLGKRDVMPEHFLDFLAHIHGAMKAPLFRNAFTRGLEYRTEHAIRNGVDVSDPMVQTSLLADAYKDGNRSVFLQDNRVVNMWKGALRFLEAPNKETGKVPLSARAGAAAMKTALPIVKIPTNIVAETFQYATGLMTGSARAIKIMRDGVEKLHPDDADLVMRELKKGSVGGAILLAGFLGAKSIGGYYQAGKKQSPDEVKYGHANINGHDVPPFLLHNPALEMLQVGATIAKVADSKLRKKDQDPQGIPAGIEAAALGLVSETPFVREQLDLSKLFNPYERKSFKGELAKSTVVPQGLSWLAQTTDKDADGNPIKRDPQSVLDYIKEGIPGLRQQVPEKEEKKTFSIKKRRK